MKYEGKKQFKVSHTWYDEAWVVIEIDFDHTDIMQKIKEMVEFWSGWERKLRLNDGDYVKTFLQNLGATVQYAAQESGYNTWGIRTWFDNREGWTQLDGRDGINILQHETIEWEDGDFEIKEVEGYKEFEPSI